MRLTLRSEYGLMALIYLARQEVGVLVHAEEIAKTQGIPKGFLNQILFTLKQTRLVKSVKGPRGGYALGRAAEKITLAEVVRLLDGPIAPTSSSSKHFYAPTPIERERKMLQLLKQLRERVADILEETSLADVS